MTNYITHHNKTIRHGGNLYRLICYKLGNRQLVSVDCLTQPEASIPNLMATKSKLAQALKNRIRLGLVG